MDARKRVRTIEPNEPPKTSHQRSEITPPPIHGEQKPKAQNKSRRVAESQYLTKSTLRVNEASIEKIMLEKLKKNQNSEIRLEESFNSKKANQSVFGKTFYKDDKDALVKHVHNVQQK